MVTLLSVIAVAMPFLLGGYYQANDISTLSLIFAINAILVAGIAYLRQRNFAAT